MDSRDDYKIPRGIEQCSLHENLIKEIGVIKDLTVKLGKKTDRATIALACLSGFIGIETILIIWGIFFKSTELTFFK